MKILMVLTSCGSLADTGQQAGVWLDEFATPYYIFTGAGALVAIATPMGGRTPVDPDSETPNAQTPQTIRFYDDRPLQSLLFNAQPLNGVLADAYDAVFYSGGRGALQDLPEDEHSIALIASFYDQNKPMAFVCHAPAALLNVRTAGGQALVSGKELTCYSNEEEASITHRNANPFLLEDELKKCGAQYSKRSNWTSYVKKDGLLITGQNHFSVKAAAEQLLAILRNRE